MAETLHPNHQRAIAKIRERYEHDPRFLAILVGGSVAKGTARPDSDVDILAIVTDEAYAEVKASSRHWLFAADLTDYPGGYVDGKIVDWQFLLDVADHGSEVARSAFVGVFPAFSRIPWMDEVLHQIVKYPEADRAEKLKAFVSQVGILHWYMSEAEKRNDRYLLMRSASDLVLYGGRLVLAYNRILFPYHKWFMHALEHAPEKPEGFMAAAQALLENPCKETSKVFTQLLMEWQPWGVSHEEIVVRFMIDTEWNWRDGRAPLHDW